MTSRITSWSTRHLSFASRTQLINYLLLSVHSFWAQAFIIPSAVMEKISNMCRHFFGVDKLLLIRLVMLDGLKFACTRKKGD